MLIAIVGKMGCGKSTVTDYIMDKQDDACLVKFAGPLYDIQKYIYERTKLELSGEKDRQLLQWLGTEWGRKKSVNLWKDIFEADSTNLLKTYNLVLNDDCRFLNEAELIHDMGGLIVRISGPSRGMHVTGQAHASEQEIELIEEDFEVYNTNGIDTLYEQIDSIMELILGGKNG